MQFTKMTPYTLKLEFLGKQTPQFCYLFSHKFTNTCNNLLIYVTTAILTILIVPVIIIKVLINKVTVIHDKIPMTIFIAHDHTAKNLFYETVHRKVEI